MQLLISFTFVWFFSYFLACDIQQIRAGGVSTIPVFFAILNASFVLLHLAIVFDILRRG